MDLQELLSPKELALELNWPEKRIRSLITDGNIEYVKFGNRIYSTVSSIQQYVERNMVIPCQENDKDHDSSDESSKTQKQVKLYTRKIGTSDTSTSNEENGATSQQAKKTMIDTHG